MHLCMYAYSSNRNSNSNADTNDDNHNTTNNTNSDRSVQTRDEGAFNDFIVCFCLSVLFILF